MGGRRGGGGEERAGEDGAGGGRGRGAGRGVARGHEGGWGNLSQPLAPCLGAASPRRARARRRAAARGRPRAPGGKWGHVFAGGGDFGASGRRAAAAGAAGEQPQQASRRRSRRAAAAGAAGEKPQQASSSSRSSRRAAGEAQPRAEAGGLRGWGSTERWGKVRIGCRAMRHACRAPYLPALHRRNPHTLRTASARFEHVRCGEGEMMTWRLGGFSLQLAP